MRAMWCVIVGVCAFVASSSPAAAQDALRQVVLFERTEIPPAGESVYIVGSLPELGSWDVRRAVKLVPNPLPTWRVRIDLPRGTSYEYQYIRRNDDADLVGSAANSVPLTGVMQAQTDPIEGGGSFDDKAVVVESDLLDPTLHVRVRGTDDPYTTYPMRDIGNGRAPGTFKWAVFDIGLAAQGLEFFLTDDTSGRLPESGTFSTSIDEVYVRDGEIFSYIPAQTSTPAELLPNRTYTSALLGENRVVRILLPRDYGQTPGKRYPVLYMHDGQEIFRENNTWNVNGIVPAETSAGSMREIIVVGIDNTGFDNRFRDYVPDGDSSDFGVGMASVYTAFIRDELKPQIDAEFLTLTDARTTGTMGSSLGACCSLYQGWDYGSTFRRVGALSGAWPFSPVFNNRLRNSRPDLTDLKVYLDSGTGGTGDDNYLFTIAIRDTLLGRREQLGAFTIEGSMRYTLGFGHAHAPPLWAIRLPDALEYLYPAHEDAIGLSGLAIELRGDVNDDGARTLDDLYTFFQTGAQDDIDNDGTGGTPDDAARLEALLRGGELEDMSAAYGR